MKKELKIYLASPRGFCAGVKRAIEIVEKAINKYGAPVYVRHEIVHNKQVVDELRVLDMPVKDEPDIVIQNIVATTNLESTLNLIQIAMSLGFENVEYEPEAFPGLVYRMDDPKVVLLLFGSGKMVCVGAREVNNIKDAVRNIKEELSTAGLMRT